MEEYSISTVRKSLVRRVVMGNMPAQWLWLNIIISIAVAVYVWFMFYLIVALFVIPAGVLIHILLNKAYAKDELLFAVCIRNIFMSDYIPATSRANYIQNYYKNN